MSREAAAIDQQLRAMNEERLAIAEEDKVIMAQFESMGEEVEKIKVILWCFYYCDHSCMEHLHIAVFKDGIHQAVFGRVRTVVKVSTGKVNILPPTINDNPNTK